MKDTDKKKAADHKDEEFKGYTIEELRYQRALIALKKEFMKEKALKQTNEIRDQIPLLNGKMPSGKTYSSGLLGKIMRGLDLADYLMLGFQGIRIVKKLGGIFRK